MFGFSLSAFALISTSALVAASNSITAPVVTPRPTPTRLKARATSESAYTLTTTTVAIENWSKGSKSCSGTGTVALIPFVTTVPVITSSNTELNAYFTYCPYSVTVTTEITAWPYTTTLANSAEVAFSTTVPAPGYSPPWNGTGTNTTVKYGKSMSLEVNPSASIMVGNLSASYLYTSISNALVMGCGSITPSSTMNTCTVPKITNVAYLDKVNEDPTRIWQWDGEIEIDVLLMSVSDPNVLHALIHSVAYAISTTTYMTNNTESLDCNCKLNAYSESVCEKCNVSTAANIAQAIYSDDVDSDEPLTQNLAVTLIFSTSTSNSYICNIGSFFTAATYYVSFFADILAAIPGFEWAAFVGGLSSAIESQTKMGTKALSLGCEIDSTISES